MALKKRTYKANETPITAENLNDIQDAIIDMETANGDIDAALDSILAIQESLLGGATE